MSDSRHNTRESQESGARRLLKVLGHATVVVGAASAIFGVVTYVDGVRQNSVDAVRIATEAKVAAEACKADTHDKIGRAEADRLWMQVDDLRREFSNNFKVPDTITRRR